MKLKEVRASKKKHRVFRGVVRLVLRGLSRIFPGLIENDQYAVVPRFPRLKFFHEVFYRPSLVIGRVFFWGSRPLIIPKKCRELERQSRPDGTLLINGGLPVSFVTSVTVPEVRWVRRIERTELKGFGERTGSDLVLIGDPSNPILRISCRPRQNHFHFFCEILPQMYENMLDFQIAVPIANVRQTQILYELGLHPRQPDLGDYSVVEVSKNRTGAVYPSAKNVLTMRTEIRKMLENRYTDFRFPPNIFIQRNGITSSGSRRLTPATEKIICGRFGFVPFDPGSVSILEQFATFAGAKTIVGPHGAGLANLLASNEGTRVIEINSRFDVRWHYFLMSDFLDLNYSLLQGSGGRAARDLISVDAADLEEALGGV